MSCLRPQHRGAAGFTPTHLGWYCIYTSWTCAANTCGYFIIYLVYTAHSVVYTDSTVHYTVDCEGSDQHSIQVTPHRALSEQVNTHSDNCRPHVEMVIQSFWEVVSPNSTLYTVTHVMTVLDGRVPREIQLHMAHEGKCLFLLVRLSVTQSVIMQNH